MTDDPKVRKAFGYSLYTGVAYQDGDGTEAPALIYADADYAVGDGKCGLHESGKQANEPAIVYVRADGYIRALDEIEQLKAALAHEMQTEHGEYCSVCGFHDMECGGHSDEDYARAAKSNT